MNFCVFCLFCLKEAKNRKKPKENDKMTNLSYLWSWWWWAQQIANALQFGGWLSVYSMHWEQLSYTFLWFCCSKFLCYLLALLLLYERIASNKKQVQKKKKIYSFSFKSFVLSILYARTWCMSVLNDATVHTVVPCVCVQCFLYFSGKTERTEEKKHQSSKK